MLCALDAIYPTAYWYVLIFTIALQENISHSFVVQVKFAEIILVWRDQHISHFATVSACMVGSDIHSY